MIYPSRLQNYRYSGRMAVVARRVGRHWLMAAAAELVRLGADVS